MPEIDILSSLKTIGQIPLDAKKFFLSISDMTNLGSSNQYAFIYYEGLLVYCNETKKRYVWREQKTNEETSGVLITSFLYPTNSISNNIDYSNRAFNFFELSTSDIKNNGQDYQNPFISIYDLNLLNIYSSMDEALSNLGPNKLFKYSDNNLDGVSSPKSTQIGITKN